MSARLGLALADSPLGRLPATQQRLIASALVLLACVAIAQRGILQPLAQQQASLQQALETARRRLVVANDLEQTTRAIAQITDRLPSRQTTTAVLQELTTLAVTHRLTVNTVTPQPPAPLGRYGRLPVRLEATGGYADLLQFLHALETTATPLRIDQIDLSSPKDGAALQMRLVVSTLLRES